MDWKKILVVVVLIILVLLIAIYNSIKYKYYVFDFSKLAMNSGFEKYGYTLEECIKKIDENKMKMEKEIYEEEDLHYIDECIRKIDEKRLRGGIEDENLYRIDWNKKRGLKIGIVSLSIGNRKYSNITRERLKRYCDTHGYDLIYYTEYLDNNYEIMWQKCLAVDKVLNMKKDDGSNLYDLVMWFDDDIYITNFRYKIEDFCGLSTKPIIMAHDFVQNEPNIFINTGQYILWNCEMSKKFMSDTLTNYESFNGHYKKGYFHEQSIMTFLYYKNYHKYTDVVPYGLLHTFYINNDVKWIVSNLKYEMNRGWKYKDFCVHFAGLKVRDRNKLVGLINNNDETLEMNGESYIVTKNNWEHTN